MKNLSSTVFLILSLWVGNSISGGPQLEEPEFAEPIENITLPAGREVKLSCSVKNLGLHKVAWIHFEGSAILTVQTHVITRNPRIKVTHDKHRTWYLHIEDVQSSDAGRYMCQINTETAKTQYGYLHVVVPPSIDDSLTSSDLIVRENSNITLHCHATGSPQPTVKWLREDQKEIKINKTFAVREYEGETLEISRISRLEMGHLLCVASNGVPPAVSKRMKVSVDFSPMVKIQHQLIGSPPGYTVTLECETEAHPASLNYWARDDGHMIHDSKKYRTETTIGNPSYITNMRLTIMNIEAKSDFGIYKCIAKNPRGETEGSIRLYETPSPTTTAPPTTTTIKVTYRKHKDQRERNDISSSSSSTNSRNPSSLAIGLSDKDNVYPSNNVDKSEQRTSKRGTGSSPGDAYDWQDSNQPSSSGGAFVPVRISSTSLLMSTKVIVTLIIITIV